MNKREVKVLFGTEFPFFMKDKSSQRNRNIIGGFSRYASVYDEFAEIQKQSCGNLMLFFNREVSSLPQSPVLEIGCGTGFLSEMLAERFPDREIVFSDLSDKMLTICRNKIQLSFGVNPGRSFIRLDGEKIQDRDKFSLIASSFAFQWFTDMPDVFKKLQGALKKDGVLLFAIPVSGSFREWETACAKTRIPYRANPLPSEKFLEKILQDAGFSGKTEVREVKLSFPSALNFFRSIKNIGAATPQDGTPLSGRHFKKLIRTMDEDAGNNFTITYRVFYACLIKNESPSGSA